MKTMRMNLSRKNVVSLLSILLLVLALDTSVKANAADWELWPRGREQAPGTVNPDAAAKAGEEGGKAVSSGVSAGTIGKTAAIVAGIIAIGIAVGSGGGGGGASTTPAHH